MKLSLVLSGAIAILNVNGHTITDTPFDSREATIDSVHTAIYSGTASCREVVSSFIARIEAFNPTVNAVISLNPSALDIADGFDAQIASGNATGSLFCIPVLLKDNYDTIDMPTTGGCLALSENQPTQDAPAVAALKAAGAIILGKTNLHEMALEGLSVSSLGAPMNSLRSPASANSVFSFRPTRGLMSRAGIMPISTTQDNIGPFARNAKDLAVALTVMASVGYDPRDNTTSMIPPSSFGVDYSAGVFGGSLKGLRFGLIEGFFNRTSNGETTPVNDVMKNMVSVLQSAGATVITINETVYNDTAIAALDVQTSEYREDMDAYLQMPSLSGTRPSTLAELYSSGKFLLCRYFAEVFKVQFFICPSKLGLQNLTTVLSTTFASNKLDAIIYPEQRNLVVKIGSLAQSGRNGILAVLTGFPVVTVPAGFSPPTGDSPIGIPIGMEILGLPWSESKLLNIAAHISDLTHVRRMPSFANDSVGVSSYSSVPTITPNTIIPNAYPIGVL
ncbi:putative amidase [Lachnellula cervina]|uniref:Putative amidase n=1 Tax=Lachnellula cervina TaxID=1316786 RepID=A0A7D8YVB7_9HELO|nr:putative amidase [Lachnellula cervina]